jgi:twitching motility protein PilT
MCFIGAMARVDSLLSIVVGQGANELRLGTDLEPKMFAHGTPKRLSIPTTPDETLRDLLGDVLSPERERSLETAGRVEFTYEAATLGVFHVSLVGRPGGFDVVFVRGATRGAEGSAAPPRVKGDGFKTTRPTGTDVLARLVSDAAAMRASDVHMCDGAPPVVRVDGKLRALGAAPVDVKALFVDEPSLEERLARDASAEFSLDIPGAARIRVHVFRTMEGISAAVRLLPSLAPSLSSLHLPVPLDDLVDLRQGLVLVCGATGCGKSTTLAALAQEALNRRSIVLTTLEDPVEYALAAPETAIVRRRQVGRDVKDFATGLRDALREDPDVLLVGEMRDPETISLALTAGETGHLVLSSLHCRSAASAIERIVDAYAPVRQQQVRVQLADSLRAVVVQHLLPRARGGGRLPVVEVLRATHAVAALVREGKTAQIPTAIQSGKSDRMITLERCLAGRVEAGEIRPEDARAVANDAVSLSMHLAK